ncbi:MAG: sugar phosphate isomerase/epimerase family protein [Planctomycetota bacterium]
MSSRREFIRNTAAMCATAAMASSRSSLCAQEATDPSTTPWLRKTLKIGMVRPGSLPLAQRFAMAKEAGFDGIELNAPGNDLDAVRAAIDSTGLPVDGTVNGTHWKIRHSDPDREVRERALQSLIDGIRETAAFGGDSILLVPGHGKDGTQQEVFARSLENVSKALPEAEKQGVKILIENVWNHFLYDHDGGTDQTADRLAEYVDAFDSSLVATQFDIGNHWKYGDPAGWIRTLGHRVVKLDIKGYSRAKQGWADITEGDLPWDRVYQALRDIDYIGWVAAEVGGGDLQRLKRIADQIDTALRCNEPVKV